MTLTAADVICESPAPARGPGSAVLRGRAKALEQYPARSSLATWASSCQSVEEVLAAVVGPDEQQRVPRLRQNQQRRGLVRLLGWLSSFPGGSWQERWCASGAEQAGGVAWKWLPFAAEEIEAPGFSREQALTFAVASLICADVIRPSMSWLLTSKLSKLSRRMAQIRDPEGMAALQAAAAREVMLDIAQWAAEDPGRWAAWVAPCPIRRGELARRKHIRRVKARMDQRTRERLPVLPLFAQALDRRRLDAAALLALAAATPSGATFEHGGREYRRPPASKKKAAIRVCATDVATGKRRDMTQAEQDAFWAWAIVEILRHTGIRLEELTELNHHALVQYRLPSSGEIVPLLQIAPSKTDQERLLLVSPELADVLAAVIQRVRGPNGAIPLVISYDYLERVHNPALPLLLQRWTGTEHAPISRATVTNILNRALNDVGLSDITGAPLSMTPHDFRRIWVTDAILNGLPPHIAQVVCGHGDINTTMGYKAVYPTEAIESHRAYLARRRATRPSAEYRAPSDQEWEEFLAHFEKRKVALGTCGRAFATPCIHEHACIRCPMLWPGPAQRGRLTDIRDNLQARIAEAEREGWHGEVDGLTVSLTAAQTKLEQLDRAAERKPVVLGLPGVAIPGQTRAANHAVGA